MSYRAILACCLVAVVAVGVDGYFSTQQGYLARPPDYDGVGYIFYAQAPYELIAHLHLQSALHYLNNITPLWTAVLTLHFLVLGDGPVQAFATRFWPVALLLALVYWIVRNRANRWLAVAATGLTAVLPLVSAGVRSSSWEFFSGQANYNDTWGLDDLRPDFFAIVLALWSVALLAERQGVLRRRIYLASAAFAAAAVLMKPSTGPVSLGLWALALAVTWYWNRRLQGQFRMVALAVGFFVLLLAPWAIKGGLANTAAYFYEAAVTYRAAYATNVGLVDSIEYYLFRIPGQLGQLEAWPVMLASLFLLIAILRRQLGHAEWIYAGLVVSTYIAFTVTSAKNPHVGEWFTLSLWVFFLAGASRVATARWPELVPRISRPAVAAVAVYALLVYAAGAFALTNWPANESRWNTQMLAVTSDLAGEIGQHVAVGQCFSYAPGPGWPAALEIRLIDSSGRSPLSTPIDIDPATTTINNYLASSQCPAIVVYKEDISSVAKVFFCPPVRQPYLQALSDWVRAPGSGYSLARSWQLTDLAPLGPHQLGRYSGTSLTVQLFLRG